LQETPEFRAREGSSPQCPEGGKEGGLEAPGGELAIELGAARVSQAVAS
jgi:hypothetical protein